MRYWLLLANTIVGLFILAALTATIYGGFLLFKLSFLAFGIWTVVVIPNLLLAAYFVGRWAQNA